MLPSLVLPAALSAPFRRLGLSGCIIVLLALYGALVTLNTYADISLKGPLGIGVHFEGWAAKARRLGHELDTVTKAQKDAARAQKEVNDAKQKHYDDSAERSEDQKPQTDALVRAAVLDYARTHRVSPASGGASSGASSTSESDGAGVVEAVPGDPGLVISEPDLQALAGGLSYGLQCRAWALDAFGGK